MSHYRRRRFLTTLGGSSVAFLAGCSSSELDGVLGNRTVERAWFRVRKNGDIHFALQFDADVNADSLGDAGQLISVSNGANAEWDDSISLNWYEYTTVKQSALSKAQEKLGDNWGSLGQSYTDSVENAERPVGVTGRISNAVATVDPKEFGQIELEIPEIAVAFPVADGPDTVQVQYPDGQIHSAPYEPPSLDDDERLITDTSFDGEFTVDFENERIAWEDKHYEGENEWEFPTGIPTESLNPREVNGQSGTILVENSIVALSPAFASIRSIWRSRWKFFDWVAGIVIDPNKAAKQVAANSKEVVKETLGWIGPTGSSDVAEQYMVSGLQVGIALRYSAQVASAAGAVTSTMTTAADIALGYQKVMTLAEETQSLLEEALDSYNYHNINPAVHPVLHRFMAEKASISIATHNGDSNIADYQELVNQIGSEYEAAFEPVNTDYTNSDIQSKIHGSVKPRVKTLKSTKTNGILNEALGTTETQKPRQPITQFQLDNANTGFGPGSIGPPGEENPSVEFLSNNGCEVRPVLSDGRLYGCIENKIIAFDRNHEVIWEHPLNGDATIITTPTIDNGVLHIATDEPAMYALELSDEEATQKWTLSDTFEDDPISPTAHDGQLYTATESQYLYRIQTDGTIADSVELSFGGPTSPRQSLPTDGRRIFVSGKYGIHAFELDSLTPAWETPRKTADYTNDVPAVSTTESPLVYSPEGNELVARKPGNGDVVWRSESAVFASVPTITPDRVFAGSESRRKLRSYRRGTKRADPRPPEAVVELDDDIVGEVTVAGEHVYCATDQSIYCLERSSLETVWKVSDAIEGNTIKSTPVVSGGTVYAATSGGIVALSE